MKKMLLIALLTSFAALTTIPARTMNADVEDDDGEDAEMLAHAIGMSIEAARHSAAQDPDADGGGSSYGAPQEDELPGAEQPESHEDRKDIDALMAILLEIKNCPDGMMDQIVTTFFIDRDGPLPRDTVQNLHVYLPPLLSCTEVAKALWRSPDRELFMRILNLAIEAKIQQPEILLPFIQKFNRTYERATTRDYLPQLIGLLRPAVLGDRAALEQYFDLVEGKIYANPPADDEKVRAEIRFSDDDL